MTIIKTIAKTEAKAILKPFLKKRQFLSPRLLYCSCVAGRDPICSIHTLTKGVIVSEHHVQLGLAVLTVNYLMKQNLIEVDTD